MKRRKWTSPKILLLYYGWRNPATPWYAKLTAIAALLYLFSPIDIIPDVIPVAGLVDDIVVTPLLLTIAGSMLPPAVKEAAAKKASTRLRQVRWIAVVIIAFVIALVIYWVKK